MTALDLTPATLATLSMPQVLKRRADAIDTHRARLKELARNLAPIDGEMASASAAVKDLAARKTALDAELDAVDAAERDLARLDDLAAKLAQRAALAGRLALLESLRRRAAANDAALKASRVD